MKRILTLLFLLPLFAIGQCDTVTGLTATGVGHASATISFTAPSASLYFVLIYNGTRQNVNDPGGPYPALVTAPLNSLTPSTVYTYTIVRYCSGSDSAESSDYYFTTTAPPCDTVTNVAASVTSNSVSITSTAAAYGDSYVIYYVRDGQTDTTTEAGADEDFQLANLRPNTVYWYQIGTICGSDTTRNTRRSFTTSNSPAYTPSYNFGWQYKRLAPDSTLNLPTMASPSLRNGKNDKAAFIYDTVYGAPAVFDPLTQTWDYLSTQDSSIVTVATVSALSSYGGNATTVIVTDSLRGGVFNYYSSGLTIDNGIVFSATGKGSGYWRRPTTESDAIDIRWFNASGSDSIANANILIALLDAGLKRFYIPDDIKVDYESISDGRLDSVSIIKGSTAITFGKSAVLGYPASNDTHLSLQPLKKNKVTGLWISGKDPYPQSSDGTGTYNTLKIGWEDLEEQLRLGTDNYGDFGLTLQKEGYNGFGAARFNTKENGDFTGDWPSMEFTFQNNSPTYKAMTIALLKPIVNADATGLGYNYGGRDKAFWYEGRATTTGQYIVVNYNVYKATTTGTTGATKPVHTSGTVSDGGISWQWIENVAPNVTGVNWRPTVIFGATDDFPVVPFNDAAVHFAERSIVYPQQGFDFINGAKNAIMGSIEALSQTTKGLKFIADTATDKYVSVSDSRFKLNNVPLIPTILSKPSGDTTFAVTTGDVIAFNDATATNFQQFTGGISGQVIIVNFNTANTTLIESSVLRLNNAVTINPDANTAAEFYIESSTTARLVGLGPVADTLDCSYNFVDISGDPHDNVNLDTALNNLHYGLSARVISPTGVSGRVAYFTGTNTLGTSADINMDAANSRLGILTAAPTHSLTMGSTNTGFVNYNTSDQTTNYERFRSYWSSNVYTVGTENGGTGTARPMAYLANGSVFTIGNPSKGFDFTRNGANIGSIVNIGSSTGNALTASSGVQSGMQIDPTISQTGTAGYNGLYITPFENSTGSGTKLLIDAGTNSAAQGGGTHTSKFNVDNTGAVTATGYVSLTSTSGTGYINIANGSTPATPTSAIRVYSNAGGLSFVNSGGHTASIYASTGTASFTIPAGTNTAATLSAAEVLTNKTLTSPVITTPTGIVKGDVGLSLVDNTSDATKAAATVTLTNKTINLTSNTLTGTTAQFNTALSDGDFATINGTETLTGKTLTSPVINTPTGIVKGDVGLGNVDNTSDANKPVSTAQQTALDLKANLASPTFTGTPTLPTGSIAVTQTAGNNTTAIATTAFVTAERAATATLTNKTIDGDDNTLQDISSTSLKSTAARGYSMQGTHGTLTYTASQTYYFGGMAGNIATTAGRCKIYIPTTGTITKCYVSYHNGGTLSSTETGTFAIRLNNTTDYTVTSSLVNDAVTKDFSNTSMSVPVSAGDYIEFKVTVGAVTTAATSVRCSVVFFVE